MHSRVLSKDEELGKRDDDFKPKRSPTVSTLTQPWRWRKRRMFTVIAVMLLVYVFVHNIPTDLGPIDQRVGMPLRPGHVVDATGGPQEPSGAPPIPSVGREEAGTQHYYDGPIKFYKLATSLHGIANTLGARPQNRNILFAVSSLQSAAGLMPMACEMAKWDRNYVHMAFLGRDPLPLDDILEVNGVSRGDCTVYFHDARADYSEYSTEQRAEVSIAGAMKHINDFMHPQAIIMDDSKVEDTFFTRAMRNKAREYGRSLIEVPAGQYEGFLWMTRLDSGSLSNWFKPNIDILIHAPPDSSGGLIRLVKSLESADYAGLKIPKLTIELPTDVEHFAQEYLRDLDWPPIADPSPVKQSALTLRHRIPTSRLSSEQASVRLLESFYPRVTEHNHVLVLSPQAELSPLYLQYLHYVILEYKYSSYGSPSSDDLLGISLDVPSAFLNGSGDFLPPVTADMPAEKYKDIAIYNQNAAAPFLYQAPSATASLIFGEKWATLHDFLSHRLAASHAGKTEKTKKLVSETEPAWLEYLLELMRARGWSMLHPAAPLVTIHNELSHIPEEYVREKSTNRKDVETVPELEHLEEEAFLTASAPPAVVEHAERQQQTPQPLHEMLPFDGDLPELPHLPVFYHNGDVLTAPAATMLMNEYLPVFRQQVGRCDRPQASRKRVVHELATDDLFCLPGVELEFDSESDESGEETARAVIEKTSDAAGHVAEGGGSVVAQAKVDDEG
ncbi:hypothetical protein LTR36_004228 [Oleoguttula mirabilis]|uniref:Uncharacterized protein n=1 Tax=Oleoguttula mirabilis TaxID=1507867 RepID=A0AAV9JHK0_9PEZI|nr:hypothetical protein LTR36_004228 [Oleoguttula mirabilis]